MPPGEDAVERAWRVGRGAHPEVALPRDVFARFVGERGDAWANGDEGRARDLFLACACLRREPHAVRTFVSSYIDRIPAYLARRVSSTDLMSEVQQQLAMRLLVGDSQKPPLLASYSGRGSLEGFVRVAAGRLAVDLQRSDARQPRALGLQDELLADDLELKLLKDAYRNPFRDAFAGAIAALEPEQRALLRLHYVEGTTTEQLARLRKVGRATIVRRLAEARDALIAGVQQRLRGTAGIDEDEFEGVLRMVRSQLDLSLVRLLRETFT
jgi:RNA polymerase sigma-70 factor, ECF subfamily